jgi:hypothetical protein
MADRHFGGGAMRHNGLVERAVFLLLMPLVTTLSIGYDGYASAGAAASNSSEFCTSIKPAVQAARQLTPILAGMSSHSVVKTKGQLLTEMDTMLNTSRSVKVQLRSAPADVRSSFKWDVLAEGKVKTALRRANTKGQIRAAVGEFVGSHPKELPFIFYLFSQCESPATSVTPATP